MKNNPISLILGFLSLVLLQVLVLNNVELFGYLNPYVYILFLLALAPSVKPMRLMLIGLLLGLCIDFFENSGALHASACVFLAFIRPALLRLVALEGGEEYGRLNMLTMGFAKFFVYAAFGIFFHHLWLFTFEVFKFQELPKVLVRTFVSGSFSLVLIFAIQLLLYRKVR